MVPDLRLAAVKILSHLISRYQLPLSQHSLAFTGRNMFIPMEKHRSPVGAQGLHEVSGFIINMPIR
jgi:hypothetical protein